MSNVPSFEEKGGKEKGGEKRVRGPHDEKQ